MMSGLSLFYFFFYIFLKIIIKKIIEAFIQKIKLFVIITEKYLFKINSILEKAEFPFMSLEV